MQQLPNVKDETCKNQDCTVLMSKRRQRTRERERGKRKDEEETDRIDGRRKRKAQRGFVLITGRREAEILAR